MVIHVEIFWRRVLFFNEIELFDHAGLVTTMGKVSKMLHDIIDTTIKVILEGGNNG